MKIRKLLPLSLVAYFLVLNSAWAVGAVADFEKYLFEPNETGTREGKRTDGALVIQDGKVLYEKYARNHTADKPHVMWSVSKTVMALLYGVALQEKRIKLDQSICDFTSFRPEQCAIQIQHVLQWATGIRWLEEYENTGDAKKSSVLAMLYGEGRLDQAAFVKAQPMEALYRSGEVWRYSSGDSILASYLLAQIYKGQDLRQVFKEKLFLPLGMKNSLWEGDAAGTLSGAYYFYSTPRDLARIGELLLGRGRINGQTILPPEFYDFLTTVPPGFIKKRLDDDGRGVSGAHIWLNKPARENGEHPYPEAPEDLLALRGHWGQFLIVIPSMKLIAVRVGDNRDGSFHIYGLVRELMRWLGPNPVEPGPAANRERKPKDLEDRQKYHDNVMKLGLGFTAKSFCSCVFVAKQPEKFCRDYASLKQVSPSLKIDQEKKSARSTLFWIFSREAHFLGPELGCVLR